MKTHVLKETEEIKATDIKAQPGKAKLMICRAAFMSEVSTGTDNTITTYLSYQENPEGAVVGAVVKSGSLVYGTIPSPWIVVRVERAKCEPGSVFSDIYLLWCKRIETDNEATSYDADGTGYCLAHTDDEEEDEN